MNEQSKVSIHISVGSVVKIIFVLLALWFLYLIRDVVLVVFVSIILSAAISPWVDAMRKKGIRRGAGVFLIYLAFFALLALGVYLLVPLVTTQINLLLDKFPVYYEKIVSGFSGLQKFLEKHQLQDTIQNFLANWAKGLTVPEKGFFSALGGFVGGILTLIVALVLIFYMTMEKKVVHRFLHLIVPSGWRTYSVELLDRLQKEMGSWLRGTLFRCVVVAALVYIGLTILGVNYALVLALIAGLFEVIPWFGPFLGAVPAVFLAFIQSPIKGLMVFVLFIVVQLTENHVVTPFIMKKAVGLDPIITIIAVFIGSKLGGFLGAFIAVPIAVIAVILLKEFIRIRQKKLETGDLKP